MLAARKDKKGQDERSGKSERDGVIGFVSDRSRGVLLNFWLILAKTKEGEVGEKGEKSGRKEGEGQSKMSSRF